MVTLHGKEHHLGHDLWVGRINDAELAHGVAGCEHALSNVFARYGTVERVQVREKYNVAESLSPIGKQSWAMVGFAPSCNDAVDRALADEVKLGDEVLDVKPLRVKEELGSHHDGSLGQNYIDFRTKGRGGQEFVQKICCFHKASRTGKWSCRFGGPKKKKKPFGGVTRKELEAAFEMFDQDGNGVIDQKELTSTMRELAKKGRMTQPSDAQLEQMMLEADGDGVPSCRRRCHSCCRLAAAIPAAAAVCSTQK